MLGELARLCRDRPPGQIAVSRHFASPPKESIAVTRSSSHRGFSPWVAHLHVGLLLTLLWAVAASASPNAPRASAVELKRQIAAILDGNATPGAQQGVYIKVLGSGRVLYSRQGTTPMVPASNLKVLTTAVALDRLGPDFRFQTSLVGPRPDARGVIHGDLYLQGSGDPTLTPPYCQPATEPFAFFARQLKAQGVRQVVGDIVADDSAFDREFLARGWLERYRLDSYAAPVAALSLNGNVVEVIVSAEGIRTQPPTSGLTFSNQTGSGGPVYLDRPEGSDTIVVRGTPGPGEVVRRSLTVGNPPRFAAGAFQQVLKEAGIPQKGGVRLIRPVGEPALLASMHTYARYQSVPLPEILWQINRESDNLFAQHLFKALGERRSGRGTAANGEAAVKEFMTRHGISVAGLKMFDGCGLSPLDRVTPAQLVGVLEAMHAHPRRDLFRESLPAGGQGTLAYRLNGLGVRAKTGTLAEDSSLSGYLVTANGQTLAFAMLFNKLEGIGSAVDAQDRIVNLLAAWPEKF